MKDLFAAVCLVAVLEGLFLFVAPFAWKRMAERLLDLPSPALRSFGGLVLLAGLRLLWWARHCPRPVASETMLGRRRAAAGRQPSMGSALHETPA